MVEQLLGWTLGGDTLDDPKAYTKPFSAKMYYRLSTDTQLIEFVCLDKDASHYVGAKK